MSDDASCWDMAGHGGAVIPTITNDHEVTYHPPSVRAEAERAAPGVMREQFNWCVKSVMEAGNDPPAWGTALIINNDGSKTPTGKR